MCEIEFAHEDELTGLSGSDNNDNNSNNNSSNTQETRPRSLSNGNKKKSPNYLVHTKESFPLTLLTTYLKYARREGRGEKRKKEEEEEREESEREREREKRSGRGMRKEEEKSPDFLLQSSSFSFPSSFF